MAGDPLSDDELERLLRELFEAEGREGGGLPLGPDEESRDGSEIHEPGTRRTPRHP